MRLNGDERLEREEFRPVITSEARERVSGTEAFAVPVEQPLIYRDTHMDRPERHIRRYRRENAYRRTEKRLEWELARSQEDELSMKAATTILGSLLAGGAIASVVVAFQTMLENAAGFGAALGGIGSAILKLGAEGVGLLVTSLTGFIASQPPVAIATGAGILLTMAYAVWQDNSPRMRTIRVQERDDRWARSNGF